MLGGLVFACEFTTTLDPLMNGQCPPDQKPCTNPETSEPYCASKLDPKTGCFDGALGAECSGCGQLIVNATPTCTPDYKCSVSTCNAGWLNCDSSKPGCTTNIFQDTKNCGSCAHECTLVPSQANAVPACIAVSGQAHCTYTCNLGFSDCDGIASNGCECLGQCNGTTCEPTDGGL